MVYLFKLLEKKMKHLKTYKIFEKISFTSFGKNHALHSDYKIATEEEFDNNQVKDIITDRLQEVLDSGYKIEVYSEDGHFHNDEVYNFGPCLSIKIISHSENNNTAISVDDSLV